MFNELHYTPAPDGYVHNWSKVLGPVRFIGLDGNETWKPSEPNFKWLEKELQGAKEKFVVVLEGYPGYSSGAHSKRRNSALDQSRDVILPLLGKYKASLMLCSWDPDYERCEPTPDKGVTQIVTGCIGKASMHRWSGVIATNPFGPGPDASPRSSFGKANFKGREWCGWCAVRHFLEFDVKADSMTFKLHPIGQAFWAEDHKTFKAR